MMGATPERWHEHHGQVQNHHLQTLGTRSVVQLLNQQQAEIERLQTLEHVVIEEMRASDAVYLETDRLPGNDIKKIPKGSAADKACDRHNRAIKEVQRLAREAAVKAEGGG